MFPCRDDVSLDLGAKRIQRLEIPILTEPLEQMNFHVDAIEVDRSRRQEMDLTAQRAAADRRAVSDVEQPLMARALTECVNDIDPVARQQLVGVDLKIRRGIAEASAEPITGFDDADEDRRTSEQRRRFANASVHDEAANSRAADERAVGLDSGNGDGFEAKSRALTFEILDRPFSIATESKSFSHDDGASLQLLDEDRLRKGGRLEVADVGERDGDHTVDVRPEKSAFRGAREQQGSVRLAGLGPARRRVERVRDARKAPRPGDLSNSAQNRLVSDVDAVERSNTDDRAIAIRRHVEGMVHQPRHVGREIRRSW